MYAWVAQISILGFNKNSKKDHKKLPCDVDRFFARGTKRPNPLFCLKFWPIVGPIILVCPTGTFLKQKTQKNASPMKKHAVGFTLKIRSCVTLRVMMSMQGAGWRRCHESLNEMDSNVMYVGCGPFGKWRFTSESRTKNVMILLVTIPGKGDNPRYMDFCWNNQFF